MMRASSLPVSNSRFRVSVLLAAAVAATFAQADPVLASSGTWTSLADGNWALAEPGNWLGGVVADGADQNANFSTLDLAATVNVALTEPRTIGSMTFGDTDTSTAGGWALSGSGITLANTSPTITVNALGTGQVASIANVISGTSGLTKAGPGELRLTAINAFTGGVAVNGGTLQVNPGLFRVAGSVPGANVFTISNGATLRVQQNHTTATGTGTSANTTYFGLVDSSSTSAPPAYAATASSFWVPAGQSAIIESGLSGGTLALSQVGGGAGSSLTVRVAPGTTVQARGSWATNAPGGSNSGGNLGSLRVETISGNGNFDMARNVSGNRDLWGPNSFATTAVSFGTGVTAFVRSPSAATTVTLGSLAGDAGSTLFGGRTAGGSVVNYNIGDLNTDTTFAGTITSEYQPANTSVGTTSINKVGTGKLTLSGTLSYVPKPNAASFGVRGGVTTVTAGTLALANAAVVPGGESAAALSTIDVRSGATLDVSGSTNPGGYVAPANQQIIGPGTIVGPFNVGQAILAPANTMGSSAIVFNNPVAGTMNFTGALTLNSGTLNFDIGATSDLINVAGTVTVGSGLTFNPNFIGGLTPGSYTLINATSVVGDPSAWAPPGTRGAATTISVVGGTQVVLNVPSGSGTPGDLNWSGSATGAWDFTAATNWYNTATASPDRFFQSDTVHFKDTVDGVTAPATTTVALNSAVIPASVIFDNSAVNYAFTGSGKISGTASVVKNGTGTVTMPLANDYTGGTTINAGQIDLGNSGLLGSGIVNLAGGGFTVSASSGAYAFPLNAVANTTSLINVNGANASTFSGPITGSGTIMFASSADAKVVDLNSSLAGATGALGIESNTRIRVPGGTTGAAVRWIINGGSLASATSAATSLGSLEGTGGQLYGYNGGSSAVAKTWVIGGLNTSTTFAGAIVNGTGSGSSTAATSIEKVGTGTLTLTGTNTTTGVYTISGGALSIGNGGTTGSIVSSSIVSNNAHFILNRSDDFTVGNQILGTGAVTKAGAGTTTLTGENFYDGATTVTGGTLVLVGGAHNPVLLLSGGADVQKGRLAFDYTNTSGAPGGVAAPNPVATVQSTLDAGYDQTPKFSSGAIRSTTLEAGHVLGWVDDGTRVVVANTLPGDTNLDLTVNFADLLTLAQNYGTTGTGIWGKGDFNYDNNVDFPDLLGLAQNYGQTVTGSFQGDWSLAQSLAVPEPTTAVAMIVGGAGLLGRRRRRVV